MKSWGTVVLYLTANIWCVFFSCNAWPLNDWELIQASTAPVAAKISLKSYLIFLPSPDNWVTRTQNTRSYLGKRWCKHKEASPRRQRCGREGDKAGRCHCWDELSAEECFRNAYVIPHPALIVREFRSIGQQQKFPTSWNKPKHALRGALPFKSTHFPVKMKVSHKLHLSFPQDFSLVLFWQFKTPLIFEQGPHLSLCTSELDYGLWQW